MTPTHWQWILVIGSSLAFIVFSPLAKTADRFFKASHRGRQPNAFLLTGSLVISWIFAKSITNAANLGLEFGIMGGVAYAGYYLSFITAGIVIYYMRTRGNFKSIHQFLNSRYGRAATLLFSGLIAIRLFNEVWSNTMVIGSYFGEIGSTGFYAAILVFTALTLIYALKGGLSSSIFTDGIQMLLFGVLLAVVLGVIFGNEEFTITEATTSGTWSMALGGNLLLAAVVQSFSYPFHDPVMTDRGFISSPKVTLRSFLWAGVIGGVCIVLFSLIGVYAKTLGLDGQAAVEVAQLLGTGILLVINFIMVTSAASTLDSTFSSFSKLAAIDLNLGKSLSLGRLAMVGLAVLGTIPVFLDAEILSATTISGTMVIGLAPVFIFWKLQAPRISYFLSVGCGLVFGFLLVFEIFPASLVWTEGRYAELLWTNVWGTMACFGLFLIPQWIKKL